MERAANRVSVLGYPCRVSRQPAPRYRPTSRVLVVDPLDRLLLLRIEDPRLPVLKFWITPGGGVEPGESFEAGAHRELWEETGIRVPELGPCVWTRRRLVTFDGETLDFDERFFVVRVDTVEINQDNVTAEEKIVLTDHRWWTHDELLATTDILAPRKLARLVRPILDGEWASEPLVLTEL
ncbi:MAG: NUDIX domain-containing protein [Chloroflexi bacterium]|nr:NUDIX domain-containing protein [Chloroflexota bacterium]